MSIPKNVSLTGLLILAALCAWLSLGAPAAHASACTPPVASKVACENMQTGADPDTWQIYKAGDSDIQGYATQMSYQAGDTISFKVKTTAAIGNNYHIDILRLGWYGGDGARLIQGNLAPTATSQQNGCNWQSATGLVDCGNWTVSRSWTLPSTAVSGVYIAHLVPNSGNTEGSHITFVVRDDSSHSQIVLQTSDTTWQAYNSYGGTSLYNCEEDLCPPGSPAGYKGAYKVSYNRPLNIAADDDGRSALFTGGEWPMIRFLERNGYDVSYISGVDVAQRPALLKNHAVFVDSGHDEYWSASQRTAMEQARDAGTNLAFFSGNTGFWKTRWESSSVTGAANRTLVSYKDTHFTEQQDPVEFTGTWRDPRYTTPADGVTPENALTGQSFIVNSGTTAITVPQAFGKTRLWRGTAAALLGTNQTLQLAGSTLGYEWDVDADNGYRPAGLVRLSSTTASGVELFTDYGTHTAFNGTATHNLTMYKTASGARVFNSGTVQWAWGLDSDTPVANAENQTMQQATVNLFADLGAQPVTRMGNLAAATASNDATAPVATVSTAAQTVNDGATLTITGTATDGGGGVVAGIEVSTDNGATWHPATSGTTSWSYTWKAHGNPSTIVKARATDDSGNIGAATAGVTITVNCPCSLWPTSTTPPASDVDAQDPSPIEAGVKFKSDAYGQITGLRFYKAAGNTGTHVGSLWDSAGNRLAQANFTSESSSGWQTVTFPQPVTVLPNTTYVASYFAPNGHYSATLDYFWRNPAPGPNGGATTDAAPLHALTNTTTVENGVYNYGSSAFPASSYSATNYWVDVVFSPLAKPGSATAVTAAAGSATSANVSWTAPSTGGAPTQYVVTPYIGTVAQTAKAVTVTGTPPLTLASVPGLTTGTSYTFAVTASNPAGAAAESAKSNAVTPASNAAPSQPTGVSAIPAGNSAQVSWTVPANNGGSAITGYTITPYAGAVAGTPTTAGAAATSATVTGLTNGTAYTFKVSATNAVGTGAQSAASSAITPQATVFDFATPSSPDSGDTTPTEVGMKFKADANGTITGIRFYKSAANTGTHVGSLWTSGGVRMAQVTFANETASGWQTATLSSPVSVTAGTTYVVSYYAPSGRYSVTSQGLADGVDNGALHGIANSTSVNGVYVYTGTPSTFPQASYQGSNYYVDVQYALPAPGQVTGVTATASGGGAADVSWNAPSTGGSPSQYVITPYVGSTPQATTTVTGTPPATTKTVTGLTPGTTYTFVVRAENANGAGASSSPSNAVTPSSNTAPSAPSAVAARPATSQALVSWTAPSSNGGSAITGYTITPYIGTTAQATTTASASATSATVTGLANGTAYTFKVAAVNAIGTGTQSAASATITPQATIYDFAAPTTIDSGETDPLVVGVKFKADNDGYVTGLRFYKAAANTGTHVGTLWTEGGTVKSTVTFSGETASGWQSATFASPQAVTAGTTYVASYYAPNGHYSVTGGGLANGVDNGVLHALANSSTPNGVFSYSGASAFPNSSWQAGDYAVDVLFAQSPPPGQVTGVSATAGSASATVSWTAPASGGAPTSYKITPYIGSTAQTVKTITGTPPATSTTVTGLTPGTAYTFTVQAINANGAGTASVASSSVTPSGAALPGAPTAVTANADTKSVIVGWTAPASDGGSAITGYTVTPYIGSTAQTPTVLSTADTSARITGLANGTSYTFTVKATTGAGTGAASSASAAAVPVPSIFDLTTPASPDSGDTDAVVVGVKFTTDVAGSATGVRFFKAAANTGTHIGTIYDAAGTVKGQVTFANETASGWQSASFSSPVLLAANTTYTVAYTAPNGHYSASSYVFDDGPVDNAPLHALANATSPNGVFAYSSTPTFPQQSWHATNYWVDVLFAPTS